MPHYFVLVFEGIYCILISSVMDKKCILCLILCFGFLSANAQKAEMYFETENPIEFDNSKFYLGWSSHPIDGFYLQEYFVEGESGENFTRMFSIHLIENKNTTDNIIDVALRMKAAELDERKKTDKYCNFTVFKKDDKLLLDFLVSNADSSNVDKPLVIEWNVYYFKEQKVGQKSYVMISFYSHQASSDKIPSLIRSIPNRRDAIFTELSEKNIAIKKVKD